jgi:hypothetical protein
MHDACGSRCTTSYSVGCTIDGSGKNEQATIDAAAALAGQADVDAVVLVMGLDQV